MPIPSVFIGSSTEQLPTAYALKACLTPFARPTVWDKAFGLNESIFGGLVKAADQFDFAVFVFDADDVARIRRSDVHTVRDNVVFELGLFTGRMGTGRAFWLSALGAPDTHIPSDLAGITHLTYGKPTGNDADQLRAALGSACQRLRLEIEKLGQRNDHTVEELSTVRILCAASSQYSEPKFATDIEAIQQNFPSGSIYSAHGVNAEALLECFSRGRAWDIVHLAMYVDAERGDLIVPGQRGSAGESRADRIPLAGVETLIQGSEARLVVIVTCDSLVLAARIARITNIIAGHKPISVGAALSWSAVFYRSLAQGYSLSEAFNRAQSLTDPGLVLIAKRDFRLDLPVSPVLK